MQEILLNVESKEIRCAVLKYGQLYDLIIERKNERQLTGNIYKGKVTNILHNIQSAFINIGEDDNGFIHISDIVRNTKRFEEIFDMDPDQENDEKGEEEEEESPDIEQVLKPDQLVLVQVVKEPIGSKGARLTSNISIAGRYLVLLPNSAHRGVSRKIEDRKAREHLKKMIRTLELPKGVGLICRTASATATPELLKNEVEDLLNTWQGIVKKFQNTEQPALLYEELGLVKRALTLAVDKRFDRILVDDYPTYQLCKSLYSKYAAEHPLRVEFYRDKIPIFERFNVEREIDKALGRKIWLPSGGYLFFERTEAMHTIDVNSGRSREGAVSDVEESLVQINLEAAEEIARQLRLRNIGGLVICDFIDMRFRKNQRRVLERLKECMKDDSAKCTILSMSEFGLVEMTRQRHRASLMQLMFTECPYCSGRGYIKSHETTSIEIERVLKKVIDCHQQYGLRLVVHPEVDSYLNSKEKNQLVKLAEGRNAHLEFKADDELHLNDFYFYSLVSKQRIEV